MNKKSRKKIPKAVREQVWIQYNGKVFEKKCSVKWCKNNISVFNFHVGHNIPDSKGGQLDISNLQPICPNCNLSMSSNYSIDEWNNICKNNSNLCSKITNFLLCK